MTTYRWKSDHFKRLGNAQLIGQQLAGLVEEYGDRLKPQHIVDAARDEKAPLHSAFTWDDTHAAELYRRAEARKVLQTIVVVETNTAPQPMFVSVVEEVEGVDDRAYVTTARVLSDSVLTRQVLLQAHGEMTTFREKYGHFKELAKVADAAQSEITALMQEQTEAVA